LGNRKLQTCSTVFFLKNGFMFSEALERQNEWKTCYGGLI
jgi:hypothetical protein